MHVEEVSIDQLDLVAAVCLDPSISPAWRQGMMPSMDRRLKWLNKMMSEKGLQISIAFDDPDLVIDSLSPKNARYSEMAIRGKFPKGLIEYLPIEHTIEPVIGKRGLFINCLWIVPPFWNGGIASALMERAIERAKATGGISVLAYDRDKWLGFFNYMPAGFFKKFGFTEVERDGSRVLLYLDCGAEAPPSLISPKNVHMPDRDKPLVTILYNSQCPWSEWLAGNVKKNIRKNIADVELIITDDRAVVEKYGVSKGVLVNGRPIIKRIASWGEIKKLLDKELNKE